MLVESDIVIPECTLLKCSDCGQMLSSADEKLYYETMKRFDDIRQMDTSPRVHIKRLARMRRYWRNPPGGTKVLDVGCSFGMFLKELKKNGYDAFGVDPSEEAASKCIEEGLPVHRGLLEEVKFAANCFDVVTLYEVIEHLTDPQSLLAECYRIIRPGGMMFISTGNTDSWSVKFLKGRWDYFSMEDGGQGHISFYNPYSISKLCKDIGFRTIAVETRRVKLVNRKYHKGMQYLFGKLGQELLSGPAKLLKKGHDMLVVLAK
jgi:2-polyprenyl-3-methyl-5-hydroxy-6-metoxy-1,4-benzoquinol methylase